MHAAQQGDALNNKAAVRAFTKSLTDMAAAVQSREATYMASGQTTKSDGNMAMMMQGMQAMQQQITMLAAQRGPTMQQPMFQQLPHIAYQQPPQQQNYGNNNRNNCGGNNNHGGRNGGSGYNSNMGSQNNYVNGNGRGKPKVWNPVRCFENHNYC